MITYQIEPFAACLPEVKLLAPVHWDEVASHKDVRAFAPNWDLYLKIAEVGALVVATVRGPGLVGYVAMYCRSDPHATGTLGAESAFYYVAKRPMRGLIQRNLIKFVCRHLQEKGVHYVKFRNKLAHSNAPILENLGFVADEMLYTLKL